ncbi:ribosome-binding factor A [Clostridia bacterium]|nr:ribosome-binding factor A [Clostridia bacterium]
MNKTRLTRVNDEILRETAIILRGEVKDPRLSAAKMISVTEVDTTQDLKFCKIYVSILADDENARQEALKALSGCVPFVRKLLAEKINLRNTPEISFLLDTSLDNSIRISKLLNEIKGGV